MGETQNRPFQFSFNSALRVEFQGARVTSDAGLILVRELDERLDLSELIDRHLSDSRRGKDYQQQQDDRDHVAEQDPREAQLQAEPHRRDTERHQIGRQQQRQADRL